MWMLDGERLCKTIAKKKKQTREEYQRKNISGALQHFDL